nr:hypothetical protein [Methylomarinum sp. Ch1-1]MDP4521777.1 hypothetical protein [Methylomarinum sp. Ch1-1]
MTFTDTYDPASDKLISFGAKKTFEFIHSIIDDKDGADDEWSGLYGYDQHSDLISSASIELRFKDGSDGSAPECRSGKSRNQASCVADESDDSAAESVSFSLIKTLLGHKRSPAAEHPISPHFQAT